jgi:tetratricopeptide (TPR) repeat protein
MSAPSTQPSAPAIIAVACGVIGAVLGAVASHWLSLPRGAAAFDPASVAHGAESAALAPQSIPGGLLAAPRPSAASPAAPLAQMAESAGPESTRTAVVPGGAPPEVEVAEVPSVAELGAADPLVAELTALLRSGRLEGQLAGDRTALIDRLVDLYVEVEDPLAARGLLARVGETKANNWNYLATILEQGGWPAEAEQARIEAIRLALQPGGQNLSNVWPQDFWIRMQRFQFDLDESIDTLLQRSPQAVADLLLAQAGTGELPINQRLDLFQALAATGQSEAAMAELESLLEDPTTALSAIQSLAQIDPERAEAELRARIAAHGGQSAHLEAELLSMLARTGRTEEALTMVERALEQGAAPNHLVQAALSHLSLDQVGERLDRWIEASGSDLSLLEQAADFYYNGEDWESATGLYLRLYDHPQAGGNGYLPLIPEEVGTRAAAEFGLRLSRMEQRAGDNDEFWGDIADAYWRIGDFAAAERGWNQAAAIDPQDGEWSSKLSAVHNGTDPL